MAAVTRVSSGCTDTEITFTPKVDDLLSSILHFLNRPDVQKNPDSHKKLSERASPLQMREGADLLSREEVTLFIQTRSLFAANHAGGVLNIPVDSQKTSITFTPTVDDLNGRISHALLRLEAIGGRSDLCKVLYDKVTLLNTHKNKGKNPDPLSHDDIKFYLHIRALFEKNSTVDDVVARHFTRPFK